jgi:pilus assembly protein Flp/PilA
LIGPISISSTSLALGFESGTHTFRPEETEQHMKNFVLKFWREETGATAIEYGLIAAGISIVILAAVNGLGSNLNAKFTSINSSLK